MQCVHAAATHNLVEASLEDSEAKKGDAINELIIHGRASLSMPSVKKTA